MSEESGSAEQQMPGLVARLRRFALALSGAREIADDLVQEACERMIIEAPGLSDIARPDLLAFAAVRNCWRRRRERGETEAPAAQPALTGIERAVLQLSLDQREVLALVSIEGLDYDETASTLEFPVETVMARLCHARLQLAAQAGAGA